MDRMDKYLITGSNGFVAQYFIEYLQSINNTAEIIGIDIGETSSIKLSQFSYEKIIMLDKIELKRFLEEHNPNYIVHFASISSVSQSWKNPVDSFTNNTNIFLNLIDTIRELKSDARILSIGSSEEYGNYEPSQMPLKEDYQLKPNNPYSVARVSQEMISKLYADSYNVNVIMTRSFNHIGPHQKEIFVIPSFIRQLINIKDKLTTTIQVGNIDIIRDFLDVRDVVTAYHKILTQGKIGDVYNVCSGNGTKLSEIIRIASNLLKINPAIEIDKSRVRPADNDIIIGDNCKLKTTFSWEQKYSLQMTITDMINSMKDN